MHLKWLIGVLFAGLACIVLACSIVGNEKTQESFSFNKSYDTLAQFDSRDHFAMRLVQARDHSASLST